MITKEQVADLRPGDVVRVTGWDGLTVEGPVSCSNADGGSLWLGNHVRLNFSIDPSVPSWMERPDATLTVVSRAPRPLYVNHDRTEPVPGDVARDADDDADTMTWNYAGGAGVSIQGWYDRDGDGALRRHLPARLRLLVDGETGQAVTA